MKIGVPKESFPGERRVALVPGAVPLLVKAGLEVILEAEAGSAAGFSNEAYREKGATVVDTRQELFAAADVVLQVRQLGANLEAGRSDLELLRPGQVVIGLAEPLAEPEAFKELAEKKITSFAMELIPRITRAQSMDALSSMATIAGYKAVLIAAGELNRIFPMLMTAAGTISPAKVFVIGAGVAGLQAIATARRLGAVVQAYDVRPAVKEQVESLGAQFIELEIDSEDAEDSGGYAKEMGEEFLRKQREMMTRVVAENDVVITTAAVPGKKSPILITEEMVKGMRTGSIIVDLAAEKGGNCELTRPGEPVDEGGVAIVGPLNLASSIPLHASQMYAKNITTFLLNMVEEGALTVNLEDEIITETMVVRDGEITHGRIRELLGLAAPESG